jgi:hypothetical protein
VSYTAGVSSPVALDSGLNVADQQAGALEKATVVLGGFIPGDTLTVSNGGPGIGSITFSDGTLTLSGSAPIPEYQAALDSVEYSFTPSNGDPTDGGPDAVRTISWTGQSVDGLFSNTATSTLDVSASVGTPSITAPGSVTVGANRTAAIGGVSVAETPTTGGETFTVVVSDSSGLLSANTGATNGGGTIIGSNSTSLTISGSLTQVDADLTTLADNDSSAGSDTITVSASDSNGHAATPASIAVTVNGPPTIAATTPATVQQNVATAIPGVSVAETGNTTTSGETFTVVVADGAGVLAANTGVSGGGGTISPSNAGKTLTIVATLAQVDADLTTLTDDDASTAADTITVSATDSFGNSATQKTIAVTVTPASQTFILTTGPDIVNGGPGDNTIDATTNTLSAGDQINGGGSGDNTLNLIGAGLFNMALPTTLTNVQVVNAQEGQPASAGFASGNQVITLRAGLNVTLNVASATVNPSNPKPPTITVVGANDSSVINLASGNDFVTVGGPNETVNGGTGNDQISVTAATIGATINGGSGTSTLNVLGGGTNVTMGANITNISKVVLATAPSSMSFIANGISGLTVNDENKNPDTVSAGGLDQTLTGGTSGTTFNGFSGGPGGGDQQRYDQQLPGERGCDRHHQPQPDRGGLLVQPGAEWRHQCDAEHYRRHAYGGDDVERIVQCGGLPDRSGQRDRHVDQIRGADMSGSRHHALRSGGTA